VAFWGEMALVTARIAQALPHPVYHSNLFSNCNLICERRYIFAG